MFLNKKVLAAAIVGGLFAGNAAAADLSAANGAVPAYFAKEIVATPANPVQLTTSASAATSLTWKSGYNFSANQVLNVRVECSSNLAFDSASTVTTTGNGVIGGHGVIGALNGLGTNVLTFSVTSLAANDVSATDVFTIVGDHKITGTDQDVTCSVGMYDQPSQAQAGGQTGLIQNTSFSGAYLSFAPSYELVVTAPTTHTADVEAIPTFSKFLADANTTATAATLGGGTLSLRVKDPDGAGAGTQTATFGINGLPVTLATLLGANTKLLVNGDYSIAATDGTTPFDAAAKGRVTLAGNSADTLTSTLATYNVGNTGFANAPLVLAKNAAQFGGLAIPEASYTATLKVAAASASYKVTDITGVQVADIVHNGTELQAPLVQLAGDGWLARLVLTNTGALVRPYSIKVLSEEGVNLTTGNLTGTIPANGTKVIDLKTVLTGVTGGSLRGTLDVSVAAPSKQIQGLYQIVNSANGALSNHVLVRPGSN